MNKFHFRRGQIIYIDFGSNIGSELNGCHYAIVLNKNDTNNNDILTVLPLSSKNKKYYLPLGKCVYTAAKEVNERAILQFIDEITYLQENKSSLNEDEMLKKMDEITNNIKLLRKAVEHYKDRHVDSFGLIGNITSISKQRLVIAKNKYDPIRKMHVSSKELDKIDEAIIENFTTSKEK